MLLLTADARRSFDQYGADTAVGVVANQRAADWAGNVGGDLPGQPIHSFGDEDRARRVQVLCVAPGGVL